MSRDKKKKKGNVVSVDFTGVEAGGVTLAEGKYSVKVEEVTQETSENSGNDYLKWVFVVIDGKQKGKKVWHNTSLTQQSLWSLRGLLELIGVEIPDEPMDLDLDDLIDREVGIEVGHEQYNGKAQARILDFFPVDDVEEETEEEEDDTPRRKKKAKDEEEEESEEEEAPKKKRKSDDDEEEEDEKPAKKKKGKKSNSYTQDEVLEKEDDELQQVIDDNELSVDLDDFNTTRKKRAAVIEALEEAGLLEDEEA